METARDYIKTLSPNANVTDSVISGVLLDVGLDDFTEVEDMTEKDRDLCLAYLLLRLAMNPLASQRVTDRDGDWEHSEGSEQWSASQLQQFLILARNLLAKHGITDTRVDSLLPQFRMKGTGFRNIRRYHR